MRTFDEVSRKILSDFLIKMIEEQDLSGNDAAKKLSCKPVHISWIKNPTYWKVVPQKIWDKLYDWKELEDIRLSMKPKTEETANPEPMEEKEEVPIIEVEHGIAIPEHAPHGSRYPFEKMEVGDSFKIPMRKNGSSHLGSAAGHFRRTHPDWKFIIRTLKEENIIRCWRVK